MLLLWGLNGLSHVKPLEWALTQSKCSQCYFNLAQAPHFLKTLGPKNRDMYTWLVRSPAILGC